MFRLFNVVVTRKALIEVGALDQRWTYWKRRERKMKKSIGRPAKYKEIIQNLDDDDVYTPATIASFAAESNFLDGDESEKLQRRRVRITLGRFSCRFFPGEGDGQVTLRGQAPTPGWYGWRWKYGYLDGYGLLE